MKYFLSIFFSVVAIHIQGQELTYKNYSEQNYLPSSEVYQVFQDRSGFIWFATDNGIVKFDGANFETFDKSNGLVDHVVFGFYEDNFGRLWLRTYLGEAFYYKNGKIVAAKSDNKIYSQVNKSLCNSMAMDSTAVMCLAYNMEGFEMTIDSLGSIKRYDKPNRALFLDQVSKNEYVIGYNGTSTNLTSIVINRKSYPIKLAEKRNNSQVARYKIWKGKIFISINRNLFQFDGKKVKPILISDHPIIDLSLDKENHLWVGYFGAGVERFSDTTFSAPYSIPIIKDKSVTTVLQDNEMGFWISTLEKGVFYLPNLELHNYPIENEVKLSGVASAENGVLMGNYKGKLSLMNPSGNEIKWTKELKYPIVSILSASNGHIFVSTNSEAFMLSDKGNEIKKLSSTRNIKKFNEDRSGNIWAIDPLGIHKFNSGGDLLFSGKFDLGKSILTSGDKIWVAGLTGISFADSLLRNIHNVEELKNDKVSEIVNIGSDCILVGTIGNGFHTICNGVISSFQINHGFMANNIYSIAKVDSVIWMGTENGLVSIWMSSILTGKLKMEYLTKDSGLFGEKVNFLAKTSEYLYAFFNGGVTQIPCNIKSFSSQKPKFYLKSITVNNLPVELKNKVNLDYTENNLRIGFGFISFNNRQITVRHKFENKNKLWNTVDGSVINYYALSPGSYMPVVDYSSDQTNWMKASLPYQFLISPPWWENLYFRITLVVTIVLIVMLFLKMRLNTLKMKQDKEREAQQKLKEEKERISQDLHDNIGSHLSSINLGILQLSKELGLSHEKVENLNQNINVAILELRNTIWAVNKNEILMEELYDRVKNITWRVSQTLKDIHFELLPLNNGSGLKLNPMQAVNVYRIIQEAINNALTHGKANKILVSFQIGPTHEMLVNIIDNGIGFSNSTTSDNGHYGLRNMKKRAAEISGQLAITSSSQQGTDVQLTFPCYLK